MSTQPSDWAKDLQEEAEQRKEAERLQTQLKVHNERMFELKASSLREAVIEQIRADCSVLGDRCRIVSEGSDGLMLQGGDYPLRQVSVQFDFDGHFVKIVKSYSNDGADLHRGGKEVIEMRLSQDHICFVGDCGVLSTVMEFSRYALSYIFQANQRSEAEPDFIRAAHHDS